MENTVQEVMQEVQIKLWRHSDSRDWSVEVLGQRYDHVNSDTVNDLVEYALLVTQERLGNAQASSQIYFE